MKLNKLLICCLFCIGVGMGFVASGAQWSEEFDYSEGPLTNGGWAVSEDPHGVVVVTNGLCSLARVVSTTNNSGCISMHRDMSSGIPEYETTLRENDKRVSWGIQIKDVNFNPGSSYSIAFQYGYILAASRSNFMTEGQGYFVGTDGANEDFLYLAKYSDGLRDGAVESIIHTEFALTQNSAYDRASIRVDFDPVSSVWRLYADRNSGIDPATLTDSVGSLGTDSAYTDDDLPYLGLMYNFRNWSSTYERSLDVDSLSIWMSSEQTLPRIAGSDGGGVDHDYFADLVEVRVSDYINFLNQRQFLQQDLTVQNGMVQNANGTYCLTVGGDAPAMISYDGNASLSDQFSAVTGKEDHPMVFVSWFGAAAYCNWKSQEAGLSSVYDADSDWAVTTNRGYRLPTEAEWSKAAAWQPDLQTNALYANTSNLIEKTEANFLDSGDTGETNIVRTMPVASYPGASEYALRDASGNVWEWCGDFLDAGQTNAMSDPRVVRGGGWGNLSKDVTTEVRSGNKPGQMNNSVGFRTVISVE